MNLSTFQLFKTNSLVQNGIELSDEQIQELHKVLLIIAKDIFDFCEEQGLSIYLGGGSALGAIRHHGFIPWDDDMDLNMPRDDYNKFIKLFPKRYGDKYWLHTPEYSHNYGSLMAKVLLKKTVIRKMEDVASNECGAFIDIFVIENTYRDKLKRMVHGYGCIIFSALVSCRRIYRDSKYILPLLEDNQEVQKVVKYKSFLGWCISWISMDTWVHIANKWNSRCRDNQSEYVSIPTGRRRFFGELHTRQNFLKKNAVPFEEYVWWITADYHQYLEGLYGDYMSMPPEDKREKHVLLEFNLGEYV